MCGTLDLEPLGGLKIAKVDICRSPAQRAINNIGGTRIRIRLVVIRRPNNQVVNAIAVHVTRR